MFIFNLICAVIFVWFVITFIWHGIKFVIGMIYFVFTKNIPDWF